LPGLAGCHRSGSTQSEKGLWLSDGLLLEINDDEVRAFQLSSISCIPGWRARRVQKLRPGNVSVFIGNATFRLSDGPSADVKRLHVDGTVSVPMGMGFSEIGDVTSPILEALKSHF
jgi:hypothetical protein